MLTQQVLKTTAIAVATLVLATGCHPTQPFYFHNDGDLSHYLNSATQIEYPDIETEPFPEATEAYEPLHLRNLQFQEFWDLTLEEAIAIALQNTEIVRSAAMFQQFGFASTGASRVLGAASVYDGALSETLTSPSPLQIDGNGNRVLQRGAVQASAVGGYADALAEFDAQLFSNFSVATTDRAANVGNNNQFGQRINNGRDSNFLISLSKRTATGGVWTARHTIAYNENNTLIGVGRAVPSAYTAAVELEMTHPLLRGAGPQVNRVALMLARIRTDITLTDFEARIRDLILDIERTYWDLHCAYRIVEANRQGREAALIAWRKDLPRSGKKDPSAQEKRSQGQYLRFNSRYAASLAAATQGEGLLILERRLRGMMGLTATEMKIIRPIDEPTAAFVEFPWHDAKIESLARSPEIRQQKWSMKQVEQEMISARNQLLPDLNLGLRHRVVGVGDELINSDRVGLDFETTAVGSVAFDNMTQGDFTESLITLSYQPNEIGSRRASARMSRIRLQMQLAEARMRELENNVIHDLSNSYADLHNQYYLAQVAYSQWMAANQEVKRLEVRKDNEERLHDQLLDAFDRRATARIEYFQRLCDYNKAIASVHYFKGSLLDYNGVALAEGPWPQKAYWDALGRARERDASYYFDYGSTRPKVISRGPVAQGSVPQRGGAPTASGQPMFEGESIEGGSYEVLPPGATPTNVAPIVEPTVAPPTPTPGAVQQMSYQSEAREIEAKPGFSWGDLGLEAAP